jgi:pimeloyl-ACP methyl ester carboxylesterase
MAASVKSRDGTKIAYDKVGTGPVVILVLGALNSRKSGASLAKLLASSFTVVSYDRRGRGASTDTTPYAPEREVEDLADGLCYERRCSRVLAPMLAFDDGSPMRRP